MTGTSAQRHCNACNKTVHNFAAMTVSQIDRLLDENDGRLCARLSRREDGRLLTTYEPPSSIKAAAILSAAMLSIPPLAAQSTESSKTTVVTGLVRDPDGALIPGAKIRLVRPDLTEVDATTDRDGGFLVQSSRGTYVLHVEMPGFGPWVQPVELTHAKYILPPVTLRVGTVEMGMVILADPRPWYKKLGTRTARLLHLSS